MFFASFPQGDVGSSRALLQHRTAYPPRTVGAYRAKSLVVRCRAAQHNVPSLQPIFPQEQLFKLVVDRNAPFQSVIRQLDRPSFNYHRQLIYPHFRGEEMSVWLWMKAMRIGCTHSEHALCTTS
jgi:hypothetical protein